MTAPNPPSTIEEDLLRIEGRQLRTVVTGDDEIVRGHLVHGVPVLPGVFHLDLVLRLLRHVGVDPATAELRRCLFVAPVVATQTRDRELHVVVGSRSARGTVPVTVRSRPMENGRPVDDTYETNFQAEIRLGVAPSPEHVDLEQLSASATAHDDAESLYAFARHLSINHRDFMKVDGRVYSGAGLALADVCLGDAAQAYLDHFFIHPVVLDFATLVPFLHFEAGQRQQLDRPFIPIYIESFRAAGQLDARSWVHVPTLAQRHLDGETVTADVRLFAPTGDLVASLTGFRAKRVRSAEHITRLADTSAVTIAVPPATSVAASTNQPATGGPPATTSSLDGLVTDLVGQALGGAPVDPDRGFYDLGLTSVDLLGIAAKLEERLARELYPTLLFEYPTVRSLAGHLRAEGLDPGPQPPAPASDPATDAPKAAAPVATGAARPAKVQVEPAAATDIAIVGLAGRYPQAPNVDTFWDVLRGGRDCVTEIPADRWDYRQYYEPRRNAAGRSYSKWGAFLDGVDRFDPLFFNISPRQAELMDPHERLFLETAWETVEDAGYTPESLGAATAGRVGVFVGVMWNDYQLYGLEAVQRGNPQVVASTFSLIPNRVSYAFDFQGPSVAMDTACSSSLFTLHMACQSILRGECRAAIAGGVNLSLHPYKYLRLSEHQLLSTDGRCRIFGRGADGYVPGEGVGAVMVRPLADAVADGDHIYGIIRGSAAHHSGRTSGFAVPSPEAQARVILDVLERTDVPVETITCIEAHGGGTTLGDQIEIAALTKAFGRYTRERTFCAIGSLKSNVGHLEGAAGIAALTKVLLSLKHRTIVPSLYTEELNPEIPFSNTPFFVPQRAMPWAAVDDPRTGQPAPRRAAISAFGFGGANVHVLVEEYAEPAAERAAAPTGRQLVVPLSARDDNRLRDQARRLREYLVTHDDIDVRDVAHTLTVGRRAMESRLALLGTDVPTIVTAIEDYLAGRGESGSWCASRARYDSAPADEAASDTTPGAVARRWVGGRDVRWAELTGPDARRISLPTYAFSRQRCWIPEGTAEVAPAPTRPAATPPTRTDGRTLLYRPRWSGESIPARAEPTRLLVFDTQSQGEAGIRARDTDVIRVRPGERFRQIADGHYEINPDSVDDHRQIQAVLRDAGFAPQAVLFLWHLDGPHAGDPETPVARLHAFCRAWAVGLRSTLPVVYVFRGDHDLPSHAAVGGLARSVRLEQPKLALKAVDLRGSWTPGQVVATLLAEAAGALDDAEIRYENGRRTVLRFTPLEWPQPTGRQLLARDGGVYLISGGAGGLGMHAARRMAQQAGCAIALFGRSAPTDATDAAVEELRRLGARSTYLRGDVTRRDEVERVVHEARAMYGPLTGVIHAAGVVEDALLVTKRAESVRRVLAPKIRGTHNLDAATAADPLDYLLLFSSASAVLGSVGAADYTAANRFMDAFAEWREQRRERGEATGRTLSLNWPMWRDGGMRINPAVEQEVLARAGLEPLDTDEGLAALEASLAAQGHQVVVLRGDRRRLEERMASPTELTSGESLDVAPEPSDVRQPATPTSLVASLTEVVATVLKVAQAELDADDDLADYGLDSIGAMRVLSALEERHQVALSPSVVTRYRSLRALAEHLADQLPPPAASPDTTAVAAPRPSTVAAPRPSTIGQQPAPAATGATASAARSYAIVAAACRFPGATSPEQFWDNLLNGRDSIQETPARRWPEQWLSRAEPEVRAAARWGGFIDGVDDFDAGHFGIDDAEAQWMDPQQRLCLEIAQEVLDRAGYRRAEVAGARIGVFLGAAPNDYVRRGYLAGFAPTPQLLVGSLPNMAAAGISHAFDYRGPALTVDTACSSSLVALHRACQSIAAGECEAALVGGVEVLLDPFVYVGLARAGVLSMDGRTRVFDRAAAGFVPGEGVGMVLVKDERQAVEDGDIILATVVGSATNNDGRTMGLTAPSHEAQVEVIRGALEAGGISATTVGYLEVNGSASTFGDPIEVAAAAEAYAQAATGGHDCLIGSVKPNIGALLHAGGVASLIKTVLAVHHGLVPPIIHCDEPHPRLRLPQTPFRPVLRGEPWPATDGPRRAGVSSFGFGGTNCHVIVQQAPDGHRPRRSPLPATAFRRRRQWLEAPAAEPPGTDAADGLLDAVAGALSDAVTSVLGTPPASVRADLDDHNFMELGLDSMGLVALNDAIDRRFGIALAPTALFRHPNVAALARHLLAEYHPDLSRWAGEGPRSGGDRPAGVESRPSAASGAASGAVGPPTMDVAIIGLAGRFPGAATPQQLWRHLLDGTELVTPVPEGRWDHRRYLDPTGRRPDTTDCPSGGFLDDVDAFDAEFFRVLPSEAESLDPQLRLLLQVLYTAAEDAGVTPILRGSRTGMFVGQCFQDYDNEMIARGRTIGVHDPIGAAMSMTANRPSYFFDVHGPSLTVDTACSSSLYAIHLAVTALRNGECDMAFAAGTNLITSPRHYLKLSAIGALSPSGHCHSFDARADGYVPAEAVAAVLLKPLPAALADGDPIQAVIRGSATLHGGHATSVTAPNPERQAALLDQAWRDARIDPATITYLEAHGTGTRLGDPIEVEAARAAFGAHTTAAGFCALGTAKAHLGHAEGAAGVTGVIKTVLSMGHGVIPAMPGLDAVNPLCRLDEGPLFVNREPVKWRPPDGAPRRAGVSSFGFGGAYAHVVLEEPPAQPLAVLTSGPYVFPFSARDDETLHALASVWLSYLEGPVVTPAFQIAATLQHGREAMAERMAVVADDIDGLAAALGAFVGGDATRMPTYCSGPSGTAEELARQWLDGRTVAWPGPRDHRSPRTAGLPTYPFRTERFWLADPATGGPVEQVAAGQSADPGPVDGLAADLARAVADSAYPGRRVADGLARFGEIGRRYVAHVLRRHLGTPSTAGGGIADRMDIVSAYTPFTPFLDDVLRLEAPGDGPAAEQERLDAAMRQLADDHPEIAPHVDLVTSWLPALPDVLTGRQDPLELYFPGGTAGLPRIYTGTLIADHYNELIARAVGGQVARRRTVTTRTVRVLEVGAGTGGTTGRVLDRIAEHGDQVVFHFTDISPAFFRDAERRLGQRPTPVRYEVFNLDAEPEAQGFEAGTFDAIIATNVVHATRHIPTSLARLRRMLAPGGVLVLNELTLNLDYLTIMFGMIPGWWAAAGPDRLPGSPLLDNAGWRAALDQAGFAPVWAYSSPELPEQQYDQTVLLCRAAAITDTGSARPAPAEADRPGPSTPVAEASADPLHQRLRQATAAFLRVPVHTVGVHATFDTFGLDSLGAIQLARTLETDFGPLPKVLLYECPTIDALAAYLTEHAPEACAAITAAAEPVPAPPVSAPPPPATAAASRATRHAPAAPSPARPDGVAPEPVAIVGLAGLFPGAPDVPALWRRLRDGADLVTEIPLERFDWRLIYGDPEREPGRTNTRWGAFIRGVDRFDATFFGISPLEAGLMDPQQRLFLTSAWWAVEDAGHRPSELRGTQTGVFVGATSHDYDGHLIRIGRDREAHASLGVGHCILANRVSFQMDLHGPSETVDTACSSSLTALHRAVRAIQTGECEAAIAGGVHLNLGARLFVALGQLGVLSPDGRCRPFDAEANGFVRGEGVGALYLKPLSRAIADRDNVHAIIRASGASHTGHVQSITVPNPQSQAQLISSVYRAAGVDPRSVTYIEAHGTGTLVGDPIEVRGLKKAFHQLGVTDPPSTPWCGLGSVKSNMGHLEAAAGLVGTVKVLLAMRHGAIPPSIHVNSVNPLLELDGSPFHVVDRLTPWPRPQTGDVPEPRRAGVSSLGFGGTNCHVLLEEHLPQHQPVATPGDDPVLIVLSARTPDRLRAYAARLLEHLTARRADGEPDLELADIAYTLRVGRDPMPARLAVAARDTGALLDALRACRDGDHSHPGLWIGQAGAPGGVGTGTAGPLQQMAARWIAGEDLPERAAPTARRVSLPGYPFEAQRHWAEPGPEHPADSGVVNPPAPEPEWSALIDDLRDGSRSLDEVAAMLVLTDGENP